MNQRWAENAYRRYPFVTVTNQSQYAAGLEADLRLDTTYSDTSLASILGSAPQFGDGLQALLLLDNLTGWGPTPDISQLTKADEQVVLSPVATLPGQTRLSAYVIVFTGFVQVSVPGLYTFDTGTAAVDGSDLYVDSVKLVGSGVPPNSRVVHGAISLSAGLHPVRLEFYGRAGNGQLNVNVTGPGSTSWKYQLPSTVTQLPALPFGDRLFVDAAIRLRSDFEMWTNNSDAVTLTSMVVTGSAVAIRIDVSSGAKPGYWLTGQFNTTDADELVVPLQLTNGTPHGELGSGWITVGRPADAINFSDTARFDPSVVRLLPDGTAFRFIGANLVRPAPANLTDGTATSLDPITFHSWIIAQQAPNYEHSTAPRATQGQVVLSCPDHSVSLSAVPAPSDAFTVSTRTGFDATVTVHRSSLVLADSIPVVNGSYDAIQLTSTLTRHLVPGYNAQLSGDLARNQLTINYQLGAGLGASSCAEFPGYTSGQRSGYCVRAINGQSGTDGDLDIQAGPGVQLVPDPANHTLTILFSPENVTRATAT